MWWRFAALACGLAGALAACSTPAPAPESAPPRGVILISIDTLGADHLGCYGYDRDTSPFLDSLARRGALFENAFAQYPSTLVSHVSMFTGLYPREHGVYPPSKVVSNDIEMLPERFAAHGFSTAGFTEGGFVARTFGFHRGFQEFEDPRIERDTDVEETFARGADYLRRLEDGERFFLFLHTYTVHDPYEPPGAYRGLFWQEAPPEVFDSTGHNLGEVNAGRREIDSAGLEYFRALYDASVRYTDDVLAGFFAEVEALGLLDESVVVITSDHGEAFLEHGKVGHSQVYPESLRVPLIVLTPGGRGQRISAPAALADLPPTLYELSGISIPEGLSGTNLAPLLSGSEADERWAYGEVIEGEVQHTLVVTDSGGQTFQVVASALPAEEDGTWVARSAAFDVTGDRVTGEIVSFAEPRRLEVRVNGSQREPILVGTEWQPLDLELGEAGTRHRIELAAASCSSPRDLGLSDDPRCLSFKLRGAPLRRLELFRLDADPLARRDLSRERPELLRQLASRLQRLDWAPRAAPADQELEGETLEALRALGYVD